MPDLTARQQSQAAVLSQLAATSKGFAQQYADAGALARTLGSLGVDVAATPPSLTESASHAGTLADTDPADVGGVMALLGQIGVAIDQPNPFASDGRTLGDSLNKLAVASR